MVSHDRFFLREFATRVLEISDGMLKDYDSWDAYEVKVIVCTRAHYYIIL